MLATSLAKMLVTILKDWNKESFKAEKIFCNILATAN